MRVAAVTAGSAVVWASEGRGDATRRRAGSRFRRRRPPSTVAGMSAITLKIPADLARVCFKPV